LLSLPAGAQNETTPWRQIIPAQPAVPDAENGWLLAKELPRIHQRPGWRKKYFMVFPGEEDRKGKAGIDREVLAACAADNAECLSLARRMMARRAWGRELSPVNPGGGFEYSGSLVFSTNMILAQAVLRGKEGHFAEA